MLHQISWIDFPMAGRLAVAARPRAGDWLEDEIRGWRAQGVDIAVSLLDREEVDELGLRDEAALCRLRDIEFISLPITDRGVPASRHEATALAQTLALRLGDGKSVLVHCRAGIGRSSLIAAAALAFLGVDAAYAFELISQARGVPVPDTQAQREWVETFRNTVPDGSAR
jgi:protein-tyrosine phosphatase